MRTQPSRSKICKLPPDRSRVMRKPEVIEHAREVGSIGTDAAFPDIFIDTPFRIESTPIKRRRLFSKSR